ncbi:glycosyltransferase family 39 protein [bacterium]|nr:glycosyltransferase family 39 protein [bacterium]
MDSQNSCSNKSVSSDKFWYICIWGIIFTGIILRLSFVLFNAGLWHDECALAINILDRDFSGLLQPLRFLQIVPPLFLLLSKFLISIFPCHGNMDLTDFVFRVIPLCGGIGSILAFYYLLKNLFQNKAVILFGVAMAALSPALINYSYEFKPYSTDVLIGILLMIYFLKVNNLSYIKQIVHSVGLFCLVMFSLPAAFVSIAGMFPLLMKDRKKFICAIVPFLLCFGIYYLLYLKGILEFHGAKMNHNWNDYFITFSNFFSVLLFYIKVNLNMFVFPIITFLFSVAGIFYIWKKDKTAAIIISVVLCEVLTASALRIYPIDPRTQLFLIPFLILLICSFLDRLCVKNIMKVCGGVFVIVCVLINLYSGRFVLVNKAVGDAKQLIITTAEEAIPDNCAVVIPRESNV